VTEERCWDVVMWVEMITGSMDWIICKESRSEKVLQILALWIGTVVSRQ
jgi:hypothetical protein